MPVSPMIIALYRIDGGAPVVVAGTGASVAMTPGAATGDGGPATEATFALITDIAVGPDGTIYVADSADGRVRAFQPGGSISTIAAAEPPSSGRLTRPPTAPQQRSS